MSFKDSYSQIATKMRIADRVLIFPHVHPDGDALGSSSALCYALRKIGIEAWILVEEPYPHNLDFLEIGLSTTNQKIFEGEEYTAVMIDCSDKNRIMKRFEAFESAKSKIVIDHHLTEELNFATNAVRIEADSAATGELIYFIVRELGVKPDKFIANAIFTAITTDTGNFQHSNTTRRTHEIVAALYDIPGFNSKPVSNLIYNRNSLNSIELEGMVLDSIIAYEDGKLIFAFLTQDMLDKTGVDMSETDRFIGRLMTIDGVEIAALCKENKDGKTKVSLRGKTNANVAKTAFKHGGGGHAKAAGFELSCSPMEAPGKFIQDLVEALRQ